MKLLLVEDEPSVISLIKRSLSEAGYEITVALDGESGLHLASNYHFDSMILDLMIPVINGMEVCRRLRKQRIQIPILMLTALGTTENIVAGLDAGADDYLTKPFKLTELTARLRTITRRGKELKPEDNTLRIADLVLDKTTKKVTRNVAAITLTATEFRLLEFLMSHPHKVFSRLELLENVWDINFNLGTNVVDVYINYLRKKIEKDGSPRLIHTVVGMGYVLREG